MKKFIVLALLIASVFAEKPHLVFHKSVDEKPKERSTDIPIVVQLFNVGDG